jgi:hypothetical protein
MKLSHTPYKQIFHILPQAKNQMSTHISASLPQWVQVPEPLTRCLGALLSSGSFDGVSSVCSWISSKVQVMTISDSFPQSLHVHVCLTFLTVLLILNSFPDDLVKIFDGQIIFSQQAVFGIVWIIEMFPMFFLFQ